MEHYQPGADASELRRRVDRLHDAVTAIDRAGAPVRIEATAIAPTDESFLCVVAAPSEAVVRAICRRGRIRLDRLVPVEAADNPASEV